MDIAGKNRGTGDGWAATCKGTRRTSSYDVNKLWTPAVFSIGIIEYQENREAILREIQQKACNEPHRPAQPGLTAYCQACRWSQSPY